MWKGRNAMIFSFFLLVILSRNIANYQEQALVDWSLVWSVCYVILFYTTQIKG